LRRFRCQKAGKSLAKVGQFVTLGPIFPNSDGFGTNTETAEIVGKPNFIERLVMVSFQPKTLRISAKGRHQVSGMDAVATGGGEDLADVVEEKDADVLGFTIIVGREVVVGVEGKFARMAR
jgi:hypothetical protein